MALELHKGLEKIAKAHLLPHINLMLRVNGVEATIQRPNKQTVEHEAYGDFAGTVRGDDTSFTATIVYNEGEFTTEGLDGLTVIDGIQLYSSVVLLPGDIIVIDRDDTKTKSYKVLPSEVVGITIDLTTRYRAASIEL
jgi:hypothetical protein